MNAPLRPADLVPHDPRTRLTAETRALLERVEGVQWVGGEAVPAVAGALLDVIDPATQGLIGRTPASGAADVDAAVAAAAATFPAWARMPARERGKAVGRGGQAIAAAAEPLAALLALESGKAIRTECRPELAGTVDMLVLYAGLGSELKGETLPFHPDILSYTLVEPLGVVGAIVPWNVPLLLSALKIGPALVAGNTVVLKASEEAPFATVAALRLLAEALPPGVLNVLVGTGTDCGAPLVAHPQVAKVTFTGSQGVGEQVALTAARKLIPVSLELGGKSPMIVCADADLDKAVQGAVAGMRFTRMGQSCTASSRIFVHASLVERFLAGLEVAVAALKIGDPLDEATDAGCVINRRQWEKIASYTVDGAGGPAARLLRWGSLPQEGAFAQGFFVQPTVCVDPAPGSAILREEIFGPVTCVIPFTDTAEALAAANDSDFGLAATIWTRDLRTGLAMARDIEAGFVQVNRTLTIQPNLSYGGFKKSGLGKEASLEAMLAHFTRSKTISVDIA